MTMTQFITIQNGNLVEMFFDADIEYTNDESEPETQTNKVSHRK